MNTAFQKGSEWRKWDLHVHTASSYDALYKGQEADDCLVSTWKDHGFAAVAITDHHIIDCERIARLRQKAPEITIFPGVEMRTDKGASNLHVISIFPDNSDLESLSNDLQTILIKDKAKSRENNETIVRDLADIVDFTKKHSGILTIHAGKKTNGIDEQISNALPVNMAIKEDIASVIDIFEIGNPSDVAEYQAHVFKFIGEKPLIICSDNHDPRNYQIKDYLWIKADPTFEGLKQVLYEPAGRVYIGSTKPIEKQSYHVIEKVEVFNENFSPTPIFFSENLTCIIGGKSTGKSLLLHNIALTLDKDQVQEKDETVKTNVRAISGMKIYWRDGNDSTQIDNPRKIVYIPQTYLNRLSDEREETTEIDSIIQSIVLQDATARLQYDTMKEQINANKNRTSKTIIDLCKASADLQAKQSEIKEVGDENGINREITRLSTSLDDLSRKFNVTEEEIKDFQESAEQIKIILHSLDALKAERDFLKSISSVIEPQEVINSFKSVYRSKILEAVESTIKVADDHWVVQRDKLVSAIDDDEAQNRDILKVHQGCEAELKPKMEGNAQIAVVSKALLTERDKLRRVQEINNEKLIIEKRFHDLKSVLAEAFHQFQVYYREYADSINANFASPSDDLKFKTNVVFRAEHFTSKLLEVLNRKSLSRFADFSWDHITEDDITCANLLNLIDSLLRNSSDSLQVKGGHTPESALREIFTDWFNIDYVVKMDNDSIHDMSPGKKALVLLKLLISLAESKCPILIDQPEDDLDNRSIFDELIQFIKVKKNDRQIIAVTHNANIVLGGDAELVIVANQQGKNAPNKEFRFEYRAGAIENDQPLFDSNGGIQSGILSSQGIPKHICEILEGGEKAFALRKSKYLFIKS